MTSWPWSGTTIRTPHRVNSCKRAALRGRAARAPSVTYRRSAVVVELELVRVRAQPKLVELDRPLVVQPGLDQVVGEHAALGEVGVVGLQVSEHRFEGAGHLWDGGCLVRRQLVQVLVHRL